MKKILFITLLAQSAIFSSVGMEQQRDAWDAKKYQDNSALQREFATTILSGIDFTQYSSVLDVGCGTGRDAAMIAQKYPGVHVTGIDNSLDMLQTAQKTYRALPNLDFKLMDAETMDFDTKKFGIVISFFAFHWMKNQAQVLNRIYKCADADVLLVMSGKVDANDCRLKVLSDMKKQSPWDSFLVGKNVESEHHTPTVDEMKDLLHNVGFAVDEIYNETVVRKFESVQSLKNYVLGWVGGFASFAQASSEIRQHFADDFIGGYIKHVAPQEDGSITYNVPLLVAKVRKK